MQRKAIRYADSYRTRERLGTKTIDVWSIITDLERNMSPEVDTLKTRIEKLEDMLRWYIEEDEIHEGDPENQYWIDGKHKAMKLLGMEIEE